MRSRLVLAVLAVAATLVSAGSAAAAISSFSVDSYSLAGKDKTQVVATGTITCTAGDEVWINAGLSETVGRVTRSASGFLDWSCSGEPQPFTVAIDGSPFTFKPGPIATSGSAYDVGDYEYVTVDGVGKLRP